MLGRLEQMNDIKQAVQMIKTISKFSSIITQNSLVIDDLKMISEISNTQNELSIISKWFNGLYTENDSNNDIVENDVEYNDGLSELSEEKPKRTLSPMKKTTVRKISKWIKNNCNALPVKAAILQTRNAFPNENKRSILRLVKQECFKPISSRYFEIIDDTIKCR